MARLRYNGLTATLGANLLTAGTTITFTAALTHAAGAVPTITGTDYIPLAILADDGTVLEIMHLTAYTTGATTGTVLRAQESTAATDHGSGLRVVHGLTVADMSSPITVAFSKAGALSVTTGTHRIYNDTGRSVTITAVRASVGTAPTGAPVIVDVHKNGTTIFTTQANRPAIAVSTNTDTADAINVSAWAAGEYLTVDIDQVGSTVAGSDLTVQVAGTA